MKFVKNMKIRSKLFILLIAICINIQSIPLNGNYNSYYGRNFVDLNGFGTTGSSQTIKSSYGFLES